LCRVSGCKWKSLTNSEFWSQVCGFARWSMCPCAYAFHGWNGKLTSRNFISHLSYPGPNRLCPTSHPIPIPRLVLNYNIYFPFPVSWGADPMYLPFFFANGQYNTKSRAVAYRSESWHASATNFLLTIADMAKDRDSTIFKVQRWTSTITKLPTRNDPTWIC
jgi:hypothetical protein